MMNLEAVTTCVNYGDILSEVAPINRSLFNRWVIVTTPQDEETRAVCKRFNLEIVLTEDFSRDEKGGFSKARGINRGLNVLSAGSWRMHLDADVALPRNLHSLLEASHLNENGIYGCDRLLVVGWDQWQRHKGSLDFFHDYHYRLDAPKGLAFGTRWVHPKHGYVPIGFFQLWHSDQDEWNGIRIRRYPEVHGNAARCDVQFGLLWDRQHRHLLPEVMALHLESEPAKLGANWRGRKTKRFGPDGGCNGGGDYGM